MKSEPILLCKRCNRGIESVNYMQHLSQYHGRIPLVSISNGEVLIHCGKLYGKNAFIRYANLMSNNPIFAYLSLFPGYRTDRTIEQIDSEVLMKYEATHKKFANSYIASSGNNDITITTDSEIYEFIVSIITEKLVVCSDCRKMYDSVPTEDTVLEHIKRCTGKIGPV